MFSCKNQASLEIVPPLNRLGTLCFVSAELSIGETKKKCTRLFWRTSSSEILRLSNDALFVLIGCYAESKQGAGTELGKVDLATA